MIWQDITITIVCVVFSAALVPQVYYGFKEKKGVVKVLTSGPTFIGLYFVAYAYYTLTLYFSAAVCLLTGTLWLILFIQKFLYPSQG